MTRRVDSALEPAWHATMRTATFPVSLVASVSVLIAYGGRGALEAYDDVTGSGGAGGATTSVSVTTSGPTSVTAVSTTTSVGPSTVVTTTGPSSCDNTGDCGACFECSTGGGMCTTVWATCLQTQACVDVIDCINNCGGNLFQCFQGCGAQNPGGAQMLEQAIVCTFCGECMNDCAGFEEGFCG